MNISVSSGFVNGLENEELIISSIFRKSSWYTLADKNHVIEMCSCKVLKDRILINLRTRKNKDVYSSKFNIDKNSGEAVCLSTVNNINEPKAEWGIKYQAVGFALRVIANIIGKSVKLEGESYRPIEDDILEQLKIESKQSVV